MASDSFYQYGAELDVGVAEGSVKKAIDALDSVQDSLTELGTTSAITDKELRNLTNRTDRLKKSLQDATSHITDASKAFEGMGNAAESAANKAQGRFEKVTEDLKGLNRELRESGELYYNLGNNNPLSALAAEMPESLARDIIGAYETANLTDLQVALERIRQIDSATKEAQKATDDWAEAWRRLENTQKSDFNADVAEGVRQSNVEQEENLRISRENAQATEDWAEAWNRLEAARSKDSQADASEANRQMEARASAVTAAQKEEARLASSVSNSTDAINRQSTSLPTLRYALYDVAQTAGIASGAIIAAGAGLTAMSAQYETAFTAVERTSGVTGDAVGELKNDLLALAREIPQTFGEIADIAARGAQLGVATNQLDDFTETVAKFVATSDTVTLDQAVEAFGRISNLLGDQDFNRIGSAITLVGVNAAATEGQIVKTTQELAPFATAVGMSTEGVIGLAAALGSLGQPPERARSAFLTLQRVMDTAIVSGSGQLEAFAKLLGKTADETAALWKQDPDAFIQAFARSLGSVEDLTGAFAALGINERRAVQVFQALAADARNAGGELSVLDRAMNDSNEGYASGTELARQYALIVDDFASRVQLLKNAFGELFASLGDVATAILKPLVSVLTTVVNAMSSIASSPVGKGITGIAMAFGLVVAAGAAIVSTLALTLASMAGAKVALDQLGLSSIRAAFSLQGLKSAFTQVAIGANASTTAVRGFGIASKAALVGTGVGIALVAAGTAWTAISNSMKSASDQAKEAFGDFTQLTDAMVKDTQAVEDGVQAYFHLDSRVKDSAQGFDEFAENTNKTLSTLGLLEGSIDGVTESLQVQSLAFGEASLMALKYMLASDEALKKAIGAADMEFWGDKLGVEMDKLILEAAEGGEGAARAYIDGLIQTAMDTGELQELENLFPSREAYLESFNAVIDALERVGILSAGAAEEARELDGVNRALGITMDETTDSLVDFDAQLTNLIEDVFGLVNAQASLGTVMEALGKDFYENGATVAFSGEAMQNAIAEIWEQSGTAPVAAANLRVFYDYLLKNNKVSVESLSYLKAAMDSAMGLGGGKKARPTFQMPNFQAFEVGMSNAAQAASRVGKAAKGASKEVKEEIRTVLDWASDLSKVWSRAFDLRFGVQNAKDATASLMNKLREDADKARQRIRDLRQEISGMGADLGLMDADISKKQYHLSIALEYGDTKRAEQLQAQLAKLEADRAKKVRDLEKAQADLKKEQDSLNKSTQGNSQTAINNRKTLQDLYKTYIDQLKVYAESGVSQDELNRKSEELRAEFVRQATQLGYNRRDLKQYENAFKDVSTAIRNVPRDVTVEVKGLSPAQAALKEFAAQVKKSMDNAKNSVGGLSGAIRGLPTPPGFDNGPLANSVSRFAKLNETMIQIRDIQFQMNSLGPLGSRNRSAYRALETKLNSLNRLALSLRGYASGGFTGRGGKYEPAGIVHKGEYVVRKELVNQRTGLPYASAMEHLSRGSQPASRGYANGGFVEGGMSGVVDLSARSAQMLGSVISDRLKVVIDGKMVGEAVSSAYAAGNRVGSN